MREGSTTALANLVASGEAPLSPVVYTKDILTLQRKGAPVAFNVAKPITPVTDGLALTKRAPNPHAALLFIDFVLSTDEGGGQRITLKQDYGSAALGEGGQRFVLSFIKALQNIEVAAMIGMRYSSTGLISLHSELEDSAQMSGASWWQTLRRVVIPLIMPALVAGWVYIFLGSFRELGVPVLLYGPGTELVASTILGLWQDAQLPEVAAFSVLLSLGLVAAASLAYYLSERYGRQV